MLRLAAAAVVVAVFGLVVALGQHAPRDSSVAPLPPPPVSHATAPPVVAAPRPVPRPARRAASPKPRPPHRAARVRTALEPRVVAAAPAPRAERIVYPRPVAPPTPPVVHHRVTKPVVKPKPTPTPAPRVPTPPPIVTSPIPPVAAPPAAPSPSPAAPAQTAEPPAAPSEPAGPPPPVVVTTPPPVVSPPPPVEPPPAVEPTRPGNGYGDRNHTHSGPPGHG